MARKPTNDSRKPKKRYAGKKKPRGPKGALPEVTVVRVTALNDEGEPLARPVDTDIADAAPTIIITDMGKAGKAPGIGETALVKLFKREPNLYEASVIKVLATQKEHSLLGLFRETPEGGIIEPTSKKDDNTYRVSPEHRNDAKHGELVRAEKMGKQHSRSARFNMGMQEARVIERLGKLGGSQSVSLIAIHGHDIPHTFPQAAIDQAEDAQPPTLSGKRTDLRHLPLVTIDGSDARDFDDAVWAEPDKDKANKGGWHLVVAIADVSHYVQHGDPLDTEAFERGNSVYFPDRVVPMLPEALSNGLCSLRPDEDRYCLAMHMWLDDRGKLLRYRLERGLMRSRARLTYEQVQRARNGDPDAQTKPLMDEIITPLYGVFKSLHHARKKRGALELDLPEFHIEIDEKGTVLSIETRDRLQSHMLIEECMICANVAAAELLHKLRTPGLFRNHETPDSGKIKELAKFLKGLGFDFFSGDGIQPRHFNTLFKAVEGKAEAPLIHETALRAQMQAFYGPQRLGHFGLGLRDYAHFTSPIRRYSDLIVHRALIRASKLGDDGLSDDELHRLEEIGDHISTTERRAMQAEREARERYTVQFLASNQGEHFAGRISGVTRFGIFITLKDSGADGLIHISALPNGPYFYEEQHQRLRCKRTGERFRLGDQVVVRLEEANPLTGGLRFSLIEHTNLIEQDRNPRNKGSKPAYKRKGSRIPLHEKKADGSAPKPKGKGRKPRSEQKDDGSSPKKGPSKGRRNPRKKPAHKRGGKPPSDKNG